jgi:hypothetical protein
MGSYADGTTQSNQDGCSVLGWLDSTNVCYLLDGVDGSEDGIMEGIVLSRCIAPALDSPGHFSGTPVCL